MKSIEKTTVLTLKGQKLTITFPNTGQMFQVETLKQILTNDKYASMAGGGMETANWMLDIVDAISYFSTLLKDKFTGLYNVKSYQDILNMALEDHEDLIRCYTEEFAPWFNPIFNNIRQKKSEAEKNSEKLDKPIVEEEKKETSVA